MGVRACAQARVSVVKAVILGRVWKDELGLGRKVGPGGTAGLRLQAQSVLGPTVESNVGERTDLFFLILRCRN